jgi:gamma-glutamylputrescine oxidase
LTMLSYWEKTVWAAPADVLIVGAGFTGLFTAITLLRNQPKLKVKIIEQEKYGTLASSRNAGFLCFGSPSELASDLKQHQAQDLINLLRKKRRGISLLLNQLSKKNIHYRATSGYELLLEHYADAAELAHNQFIQLNILFKEAFKTADYYRFLPVIDLPTHPSAIQFKYEGQINPAATVAALRLLAENLGANIMYNTKVTHLAKNGDSWLVETDCASLQAKQVVVANNAFASELVPDHPVIPQRAQVLVTSPLLRPLSWKGNFHVDFGYIYFRNIGDNRILLGGARNTAFEQEQTAKTEINLALQAKLEDFLQTYLLPPATDYSISDRWSGIMGFREPKQPAAVQLHANGLVVVAGMNGMGAALGPALGEEAALHLLKVIHPTYKPQKLSAWLKLKA